MALTADFHLHSNYSGDSTAKMEDMILSGIQKGLTHMCFTEHHDIDYIHENDKEKEISFLLNVDSYLYELATLKEKYINQIQLLFGVELGIQPHIKKDLLIFARGHEYDFIIASAHLCHRKDPYYPAFFEGRSDQEAYDEYFTSIIEDIKAFHNYDVFGHLDYAVRYGKTKNTEYSYLQHADKIDEILKLLIENEKGIELNTGGFRAGLDAPNPCVDIIRRYKELGGEIITVGSDAHRPEDIGCEFAKASDILKSLGFKYYTVYANRMPEMRIL
ncbi:MAG: histidinol-phosphatase HisJ family protein [Lachnospiraceae bacterium]|nr:histidinol-phosphatase HisJ family protein [Lachnospiraceae bacterium]